MTMQIKTKYKQYPKYKPSVVEWIGEIPGEWELRRLTTVLKSIESGGREKNSIDIDDGAISIGGEHVGWQGELLIDNPRFVSIEYFNSMNKGKVRIGDVLLVKDGATIGKTAYVYALPKLAALNEHVFLLRGKKEIDQKFLFYFIFSNTAQEQINLSITGSAQPGLNRKFKLILMLSLPTLSEQRVIADFLDLEMARINSVISRQTQMLELLKEKRSAIITQAVTKGIKPKANMKPSGVEWVGDIPEGWEVWRLRRLCSRVTDGAHISPDISSEDYPFASTVDITNGHVDLINCIYTSTSCYTYLVRTGCKPFIGDVLFSKDGTVGKTAVVNFKSDFVVASSLVIITPKKSLLNTAFLNYYLNNNLLQQEIILQMSGTAIQRISVDKVGRLLIALPPIAEQNNIVNFLDYETEKIDALVRKIEKQIKLLNEYKQSLITHAVTGKIDVRGEAA